MDSLLCRITRLEWDSEFFGFNVGSLRANDDIDIAHLRSNADIKNSYRLLYIFSDKPLVISLFHDVRLIYRKNVTKEEALSAKVELLGSEYCLKELYELSYTAGEFSRFNRDPTFHHEHFLRLYRTWVDNSVNQKIADNFFVIRDSKTIQGFVTSCLKGQELAIGLIAVAPAARGRGYGKSLLAALNNYAVSNQARTIVVPTQQANVGATRFYESIGYTLAEQKHIYHLWL